MGDLASKLMAELECETVFTIPVFGGIGIAESVVVTWIIMAILIIGAIILTRNLKIDHISKRQAVAELIYTKLTGLVEGMIGPAGKSYVPYLTTVLLYIGLSINILEVFTRPLSLCMRLFGNVLGAFVIMELIKIVVPVFLPAVFSLYFDLFDGLLQAYVFVFLTSMYIAEAIE